VGDNEGKQDGVAVGAAEGVTEGIELGANVGIWDGLEDVPPEMGAVATA
jgi:hypothetical protein